MNNLDVGDRSAATIDAGGVLGEFAGVLVRDGYQHLLCAAPVVCGACAIVPIMPTSFTVTNEDLSFFFGAVLPHLNERQRRIATGAAARALGHGGVKAVAVASGMSLSTVQSGALAVDSGIKLSDQVRTPGAGRKPVEKSMPGIVDALDDLVEPGSRRDPECALRWTTRSTRNLANNLTERGFKVTHSVVAKLLAAMGFSLRAARKSAEGSDPPNRDAQFRYLVGLVEKFRAAGEPVISVDAKKKEPIGDFATTGRQWRPTGQSVETNTHDFPDLKLGKAIPREVYDVTGDVGWVAVGGSSNTVEFAVAMIRMWWAEMGAATYPDATKLLISVDSGGLKSSWCRLWKKEVAALAKDVNLDVVVCHFPPGTSKWNKVDHRLIGHIYMNWHGRVMESRQVAVNLIAGTITRAKLIVGAEPDHDAYQKKIKVTNQEIEQLPLVKHEFHGDWNYTLKKSMNEPSQESE